MNHNPIIQSFLDGLYQLANVRDEGSKLRYLREVTEGAHTSAESTQAEIFARESYLLNEMLKLTTREG